ncbi:MAG: T9SS type A sorting domain-containing protein [Salinivirgaceae bacterium]|jgi:uncharacterized membrane protein|nr:T9SS type A sorting domain-containing protein [Salinivirgaceae bacterium]
MRIFNFFTKSALLTVLLFAWSSAVWGQYEGSGTFTKITSEAELVDGFYVIANSTSEEFVMSNTNGGSYFDKSDLTPASGEFVDPAASVVWEITDDGNGNKIVYNHETSKYVAYSGSSNNAFAVANQDSNESLWTITYDAGGSEFIMTNVDNTARILQYNAGAPRFACYTSNQQKLSLFVMPHNYEIEVKDAADAVVSSVEFGAVDYGYAAIDAETISITNIGTGEITGLSVASSDASFEVNQPDATIAATYTSTFTVAPTADLTAGTYTGTITVTAANEVSESFVVSFTVNDTYGLSLDADAEVVFTAAEVGYTPVEETVTIENLGSGELTGLAVASSATDFVVTQPAATLASTYTTTFTVAPAADLTAGTYTGTISVTADNEVSESFDVTFNVTDTYELALDADAEVVFTAAEVGYTPVEETVTIENLGSGELTGLAVASSATDFVVTQPAATLAATYSTTFTVAPVADLTAGTYTGTITVTADNDLSESFDVTFTVTETYEIALTDGENAIVSLLEFATAELGYTAIDGEVITVENAGTGEIADLAVTSNDAAFEVSALSATSITYSETATFSVNPAEGLTAGTYTATIEVTAANEVSESFVVAFEVTAPSAYMVTFNVADEAGTVIQGATVNVNETDLTTDVDGIATIELEAGDYPYTVNADGYIEYTETVQVVDQTVGVDVAMIEEEAIVDPINVTVDVDGFNATMMYDIVVLFNDSFEDGTFDAWAEVVEGDGTVGDAGLAHWYVSAPDGGTAPDGVNVAHIDWGYSIDTWMISPSVEVSEGMTLGFQWNKSYTWSVDPYDNDDLMVKISTDDGATWTSIWSEQDYGEFEDFAWIETVLDLSAYAGQSIQIAFNVLGDDNGTNEVDMISVSSAKRGIGSRVISDAANVSKTAKSDGGYNYTFIDGARDKAFVDYTIYLDDMTTPYAENVTANSFEFTDLAIGTYTAGVQKVYTNGTSEIVTVGFEIVDPVVEYEITFSVAQGNGAISATVNEEAIASGDMVEEGLTVLFTATPDAGWEVSDWLYNGGSTGITDPNVELSELDADANIMVEFSEVAPVLYNVTFNVVDDNSNVLEGATVTFDGTDYTTDADGQVIITDLANGTYPVTVTKDGYSEYTEPVIVDGADEVVPVTLTGMEAITVDFNIYPNPTSGNLNIKVQGSYDVTVVNAIGRVIATEQIDGNSVIDLSNNVSGVYFIRLQSGDKVSTKRIILE